MVRQRPQVEVVELERERKLTQHLMEEMVPGGRLQGMKNNHSPTLETSLTLPSLVPMHSFPYTHTPYLVHTVQELQEHDIGVLMIR